jgi:hypothetical protein
MGFGEMAENEVGLARPAVPRPEQQALAADIGWGWHEGALGGVARGI